jgi:hypothetical protein
MNYPTLPCEDGVSKFPSSTVCFLRFFEPSCCIPPLNVEDGVELVSPRLTMLVPNTVKTKYLLFDLRQGAYCILFLREISPNTATNCIEQE